MTSTSQDAYQRQKDYCAGDVAGDLIDGSLFVESIRKLGYRDVVRAVDELVDNSIEAGASNFFAFFGYSDPKSTKPTSLAFADDGYGMIPEMVSAACRWGGTDRHGSRALFGRFGFGLPSASVSQGRCFSVYSRIDDGAFHRVTIDVDSIVKGEYTQGGRVATPAATPGSLPKWLGEDIEARFPGGLASVRTVVVWDKLDFKKWRTKSDLERNLLQRFGVTYRGFLRSVNIVVNGTKVQPIDPLFTTPGARYYEPLPDGAEPLPGVSIPVKDEDSGESLGEIVVRYSYMHHTFLDGARGRKGGDPAKARFGIRKENNGLIMLRHGRQVDVIDRQFVVFLNNHRYVGVEIDFPAAMDDLFGVTTSKQQVTLSDRVITLLRQAGVHTAIRHMYDRYGREAKEEKGADMDGDIDGGRTSEKVMEEVGPILRRRPASEELERTAQENLEREIDRAADEANVPRDVIVDEKVREVQERPYKVLTERIPGGPFYRAEQRGSQLVISLNTAHRFYQDIYVSVEGFEGRRIRTSLELLLFVMGQSEMEATLESQIWYSGERIDWSRKLDAVLVKLDTMLQDLDEEPDADDVENEPAGV